MAVVTESVAEREISEIRQFVQLNRELYAGTRRQDVEDWGWLKQLVYGELTYSADGTGAWRELDNPQIRAVVATYTRSRIDDLRQRLAHKRATGEILSRRQWTARRQTN